MCFISPFEWKETECFYFTVLICCSQWKAFFFSVLLSPVLFVDSTEVTGAKAQSSSHLKSPVCINVEDLSLADRFSANRREKGRCSSSSAVLTFTGTSKSESSVWHRRRSKEEKHCQPAVWAFESSTQFLPLSDRGGWLWFLVKGGGKHFSNVFTKKSR